MASENNETSTIEELALMVAYHSDLYYNQAAPEISDAEFDNLVVRLGALSPNHPQLTKVGSDPDPGSVKVNHQFPMLSLDKATTVEEITHFTEVTTEVTSDYLSQPKYDGSALSLEYRCGRLVRAATRGNGTERAEA